MGIHTTEIKDKNKKLSYYEEVFPKLNKFYDENYKTVEVNKIKANKYDCLIKKIEDKLNDIDGLKMCIVTSQIHSTDEKLEMLKKNQVKKEILKELLVTFLEAEFEPIETKEIEELGLYEEFIREPFESIGHLEYKTDTIEMHDKINELVRALNKLIKEREEK